MNKLLKLCTIILFSIALNSCSGNDEVTICVSKNAHVYHSKNCRGVRACTHELKTVSLAEAKKKGRRECGYCY